MPGTRPSECANALKPAVSPHFGCALRGELGRGQVTLAERRALRADEAPRPKRESVHVTRRRTRSATTAVLGKAHANLLRASLLPMPPFLQASHQPPSGPGRRPPPTPIWTMPSQDRHASARPLSASRSTIFDQVGRVDSDYQSRRAVHARNPRRPTSPPLRSRSSPARWTSTSATSASRPPSIVP